MKKLFSILGLFSVIFSACGSDSKTSGNGQTTAQNTYVDQCTLHKKVMDKATNVSSEVTIYEHSVTWQPEITENFSDYQTKSYETDVNGKILDGALTFYGKGRSKFVHVNETDSELTDIYYDTDSSYSNVKFGPYTSVKVWRKDSNTKRTLVSNMADGVIKPLDLVKTVTDIDDSTQLLTYLYSNPDQLSSDTQKVLEYSKSCIETYQEGRVE